MTEDNVIKFKPRPQQVETVYRFDCSICGCGHWEILRQESEYWLECAECHATADVPEGMHD